MTNSDPPAALRTLEAIRSAKYPDIDAELLAEIYRREHEEQFEDERGVFQAQLRDLISETVS